MDKLKEEGGKVSRKVYATETGVIMAAGDVGDVSSSYGFQEYALICFLYVHLFHFGDMSQIHFLCQFSLKFFLDVFQSVIRESLRLKGTACHMCVHT